MQTFDNWLETAPSWVQPNNDTERTLMAYVWQSAALEMTGDTLVLMQQSMLRGVKASVY